MVNLIVDDIVLVEYESLAELLDDDDGVTETEDAEDEPQDGCGGNDGDEDDDGVEEGLVDVIAAQVVAAAVLRTHLAEVVVAVVAKGAPLGATGQTRPDQPRRECPLADSDQPVTDQ